MRCSVPCDRCRLCGRRSAGGQDLKVGLSKEEEENVRRLIEQREAESLRQLEEEEAREAAREEARTKVASPCTLVDAQPPPALRQQHCEL